MRGAPAALLLLLLGTACAPRAVLRPAAALPSLPGGVEAYQARRPDGSELTYFVWRSSGAPPGPLPLAVFLPGSGCDSQFSLAGGRVVGNMSAVFAGLAPAGVLVASPQKRGVPFGFAPPNPGSGEGCPEDYTRHASLDSRAADAALLIASARRSGLAGGPVLVAGHSEGAFVAAEVAGRVRAVTHAASLAGGGPSQAFDRMVLMRRQDRAEGRPPAFTEGNVAGIETVLRDILAHPDDSATMFQGHSYKRWYGYMAHPPLEAMLRSKAKLFLAHASLDNNASIEGFDLLVVELIRHGRRGVTVRRFAGLGHGFEVPGADLSSSHLPVVFSEVFRWFGGDL